MAPISHLMIPHLVLLVIILLILYFEKSLDFIVQKLIRLAFPHCYSTLIDFPKISFLHSFIQRFGEIEINHELDYFLIECSFSLNFCSFAFSSFLASF